MIIFNLDSLVSKIGHSTSSQDLASPVYLESVYLDIEATVVQVQLKTFERRST